MKRSPVRTATARTWNSAGPTFTQSPPRKALNLLWSSHRRQRWRSSAGAQPQNTSIRIIAVQSCYYPGRLLPRMPRQSHRSPGGHARLELGALHAPLPFKTTQNRGPHRCLSGKRYAPSLLDKLSPGPSRLLGSRRKSRWHFRSGNGSGRDGHSAAEGLRF